MLPQYDRPEWFAEQLAKTISKQIDKKIADEVGRRLQNKHVPDAAGLTDR